MARCVLTIQGRCAGAADRTAPGPAESARGKSSRFNLDEWSDGEVPVELPRDGRVHKARFGIGAANAV